MWPWIASCGEQVCAGGVGWGGVGLARASGPASQWAALILLWVVFTTKPAIEKEILTVYRGSHPGRLPQPPLLLHHLPLQAFCTLSSSRHPAGGPPSLLQGSSTLTSAAGPSTLPCRSQFESFCFLHRQPHPTPGCLPCSDSTVSRPAILRPTLQLQSFVS